MTTPTIPTGVKIRVVGDVHGDSTGFAYATATDRFNWGIWPIMVPTAPEHCGRCSIWWIAGAACSFLATTT